VTLPDQEFNSPLGSSCLTGRRRPALGTSFETILDSVQGMAPVFVTLAIIIAGLALMFGESGGMTRKVWSSSPRQERRALVTLHTDFANVQAQRLSR
jgi:hypothetical protein